VGQYKQNLLKFDQQRFVSEELEADSYQRLKAHTLEQIDRLNIQIADLEITDTAFQKYVKLGNKKCGDTSVSENVSGDVPRTGLEPAHLVGNST
jgi:hypothetical protein